MSLLRKTLSLKTVLILFLLFLYLMFFGNFPFNRESVSVSNQFESVNNSREFHLMKPQQLKTILLWNGVWRKEVQSFGQGDKIFVKQNCPVNRCEIVTKKTLRPIESYDAIVVVLHNEKLKKSVASEWEMPKFPNGRKPHQRVIFLTQEPPPNLKPFYNTSELIDFFNWTMTYRMDSDIPFLYGRVLPKKTAPRTAHEVIRYREMAKKMSSNPLVKSKLHNKTRSIAWMVSHCQTHGQREKYVEELRKYIDVDIFGKCGDGKVSCERHHVFHTHPKCKKMVESTYKFYLSFENSICKDYVTEKFFKTLNLYMVPVVYGGADYTQHAPPHSYIDARKFTPKELAAYLKLLNANDALYNEYFWWKDHYRVEFTPQMTTRHGFCDLCQKLHDIQTQMKSKADQNVISELGDDKKCQRL